MATLQMKLLSSLEKCFYDDLPNTKAEKTEFYMFRNERLSFQVAYRMDDPTTDIHRWFFLFGYHKESECTNG